LFLNDRKMESWFSFSIDLIDIGTSF
jgi:hypothetical protein